MYGGAFKAFSDFKKAELRHLNWKERCFLPDLPAHVRKVYDEHALLDCDGSTNKTYGNFYLDRHRLIPPRYDVVDDIYNERGYLCPIPEFPKDRPTDKIDYIPNDMWRRSDVNELHLPDVVNIDMQIHTRHGEMSEILRSAEGKDYVLNTPTKHASLRGADIKSINLEFFNNDKSVFHLSALPVGYDCGRIWRN